MIISKLLKSTISSLRKYSTMTSLPTIVEYLEEFAPKSLAESWDNTGLLVEPTSTRVAINRVLLTNDLTEDVVEEACESQANLIISYHPPIFKPLQSITRATWKERVIGTCIENKIAIYSPHTSWDSVQGGVNDWLVSAFNVETVHPILPNEGNPSTGGGRLVNLKLPISVAEAIVAVKKLTQLQHLKLALARNSLLESKIRSVGICAGSGSSVLSKCQADLYLTGEMAHHDLLDAVHNNTSVILCNHSDSERGYLKSFAQKLNKKFPELTIIVSVKDKDPIQTV